jgi:hypothetical protein
MPRGAPALTSLPVETSHSDVKREIGKLVDVLLAERERARLGHRTEIPFLHCVTKHPVGVPRYSGVYAMDFKDFATWCEANGFAALPASAETTADYVSSLADRGLAPSTIGRRVAARRYRSPRDYRRRRADKAP